MNEAKIENAVRSLYFKGKAEGYGDINAWDFLVEFTKNVLEELEGPSKTPIGAWRDEMVEKIKRDFFAEYEAAQEAEHEADQAEVEARTRSADALTHFRALEAKGLEMGWLRK